MRRYAELHVEGQGTGVREKTEAHLLDLRASELCVGGQLALRGRPRGRAAPWWAVGHFVERGVLSAVSMLWDGA